MRAALLLPTLLLVVSCSSETDRDPAPEPAATSSATPSPSPTEDDDTEPPAERDFASLSVDRTSDLATRAGQRFSTLLDDRAAQRGGRLPDRARVEALFDQVDAHPVVFLQNIALNRQRTGYAFCIRSLNQKAGFVLVGGRGPVPELTSEQCGGGGGVAPADRRPGRS